MLLYTCRDSVDAYDSGKCIHPRTDFARQQSKVLFRGKQAELAQHPASVDIQGNEQLGDHRDLTSSDKAIHPGTCLNATHAGHKALQENQVH